MPGPDEEEAIPPDDPRFEGAQLLNQAAFEWHSLQNMEWSRDASWAWRRWQERAAVGYDPKTGEEWTETWDHEHCLICHSNAFSVRYDGDLREGWTAVATPADDEECEEETLWLCPDCFEEHRERFGWSPLAA